MGHGHWRVANRHCHPVGECPCRRLGGHNPEGLISQNILRGKGPTRIIHSISWPFTIPKIPLYPREHCPGALAAIPRGARSVPHTLWGKKPFLKSNKTSPGTAPVVPPGLVPGHREIGFVSLAFRGFISQSFKRKESTVRFTFIFPWKAPG